MNNLDTDLVEFFDLINFTLKEEFLNKWKYRFSIKFLKEFQMKLLTALKERKPIKVNSLFNYLMNKCGYSKDQILNFFEAIDINIYYPIVLGKLAV